MNIYLPYHLGAGNRGCEGIARGIIEIFNLSPSEIVLYETSEFDREEDVKVGLNKISSLMNIKDNNVLETFRKMSRVFQKFGIDYFYNHLMTYYYLRGAQRNDLLFITGGDIYCYEGAATLPNLIAQKASAKGVRTVLYCASLENKYMTSDVIKGLKNYDLILSRESLTSELLDKNGLTNYLVPDPAFSLESEECDLPSFFQKKVVGINISPFTDRNSRFVSNMRALIDYLLISGYEVCMIPHVFWKDQDDRLSITKIANLYDHRIHILDSENMSYLQIRYAISKCAFFVGGRTHSVVSAYCSKVPCIALGYSVKAIGIARDIGIPEYTIINSKELRTEYDILNVFKKLEAEIVDNIYTNIDKYKEKSRNSKQYVESIVCQGL